MAHYQVSITDEDSADGMWRATLLEEDALGMVIGDPISEGEGFTVRAAVADLDFHHDWTRHLIELDNRNNN